MTQEEEKLNDKDSWTFIEENYPNITQEEKLRLYDISIKSRLAGADTFKKQMKEILQTEYEKGRFDMRNELMKDAVEGTVVGKDRSTMPPFQTKCKIVIDRVSIDAEEDDKVKIIICKSEQQ